MAGLCATTDSFSDDDITVGAETLVPTLNPQFATDAISLHDLVRGAP